uniref:Ig-like domain-containing protein n=1 Tax=Amphiprion ocellaris TaxID=80972 RepID=A0AAQ5XT66_AMPOC
MIRPFYLVFCIFTSCLVAEQAPKYALLGQTVSLDPFGITVSPDDILWKHKGDKVVEFNGNEQHVYGTFDNRITLDWLSAELSISDLRYEDSGVYVLEAYTKKELKRASFTLEVIDRVAKPTISCEMNNGNSSIKSGNQATLKCSAEARLSPSLTKFEWSSQGTLQLGEKLIIPLGDEHDDKVYDCTVSNPLTKESTTFTAKDCYPEGGSAGLTAGISVAIIALVLIILGVVLCKLKQKACFAKERGHDVEKPPGKMKGSGNEAAQDDDERRGLIHRVSTLASKQPLRFLTQREINPQNDDTEDSDQEYRQGLEKKQIRAASPRPVDSAENNKGDTLAHSSTELPEEERGPLDSKKSNYVSGDESENKRSDLQPATASEQPEAEEEANEEAKSPSANGVPPHAAQLHLPETENSQNQSPQDGSGEHEDQTVSDQQDQDNTEKNEGNSSEPEEGKKSEDLNQKSLVNFQALRNIFEPHNENQKVKEESKQIPAHPQDSAESDKGDPDVESPKESTENKDCDPSDSEKPNVVSEDKSENAESDLQPPAASKQPVKQEEDGGDDTSLPVGRPVSPLTQDSLNIAPQDGAGKQEKDASSDQVTGGTTDLSQDGSDLLNSKEENESNNHSDVKENSTVSEEKGPEATDE